MTKILINAEGIKDDVLEEAIEVLEKATDCPITWRQVYVLESESEKALKILHSLFGGSVDESAPRPPLESYKKKKLKGGKPGRVVKNKWQVLSGEHHVGEALVTQQVNKMIKSGELSAGSQLIHPKLGVRFVSNGKLIEEPTVHPTEVPA